MQGVDAGKRTYTVLLIPDEGGYAVEVPSLPGCFTQGETRVEALANAREAIHVHIRGLEKDGEPVPVESAAERSLVLSRQDVTPEEGFIAEEVELTRQARASTVSEKSRAAPHMRLGSMAKYVDKMHGQKDFTELAELPIDSLQGMSAAEAEALSKALGVHTIRQLAEHKIIRAARAITLLAGDE